MKFLRLFDCYNLLKFIFSVMTSDIKVKFQEIMKIKVKLSLNKNEVKLLKSASEENIIIVENLSKNFFLQQKNYFLAAKINK